MVYIHFIIFQLLVKEEIRNESMNRRFAGCIAKTQGRVVEGPAALAFSIAYLI